MAELPDIEDPEALEDYEQELEVYGETMAKPGGQALGRQYTRRRHKVVAGDKLMRDNAIVQRADKELLAASLDSTQVDEKYQQLVRTVAPGQSGRHYEVE